MLSVIYCFVDIPINLTGGIFTIGTGLYIYILSFVNSTTDIWSATSFANSECAAKDTSVDEFYTSLSLHDSVDFFVSQQNITLPHHHSWTVPYY